MSLVPWRARQLAAPFRSDLEGLLNRFLQDDTFERFDRIPATFQSMMSPPINISETDKTWTVAAELPGLEEKDIKVQVMGRQLVISGERKWEEEKKSKDFRRVESQYGAFERVVTLPDNVNPDADAIVAKYKKGILEVTLKKVEPTPKSDIKVTAG